MSDRLFHRPNQFRNANSRLSVESGDILIRSVGSVNLLFILKKIP
nr:MAG TPA: hypothetical protein [Caudoviricetes sp.]